MIKAKVAFWRADFLKTFQIALIGWIKAGPPKKPLLFDHVNRLTVVCNNSLSHWLYYLTSVSIAGWSVFTHHRMTR